MEKGIELITEAHNLRLRLKGKSLQDSTTKIIFKDIM